MATSATNDLGQLLGSTPPLSPAPGVSERPPSTDSNPDLANTPHHHSQHESNLTSRAEWSVQKGYDETWLHDDDSMDGHVHPTHTNPTATSETNDLDRVVYIYYLASAPARCGPLAAVGAITRPPSQPQTASERS